MGTKKKGRMARQTSDRGFGKMVQVDPERQREIASHGGRASSGKFEAGSARASEAGKKGAEAQPIAAKRRGGQNSRRT